MDPFAVLGVERRFALDRDALEKRYRDLQRALHPDKHVEKAPSERRASLERAIEVNEAYRILRNDLSRAEALLRLAGVETRHSGTRGDPEMLMEMLDLREELGEAKASGDTERTNRLRAKVEVMRKKAFAKLAAGLDGPGFVGRSPFTPAVSPGGERGTGPAFEPRLMDARPLSPQGGERQGEEPELMKLLAELERIRYLQRFLDEVDASEEMA